MDQKKKQLTQSQRVAIEFAAAEDAHVFVDEFPGEYLDPSKTDWDAEAWSAYSESRNLKGVEGSFELYQSTLVEEVRRLVEDAKS